MLPGYRWWLVANQSRELMMGRGLTIAILVLRWGGGSVSVQSPVYVL